MRIVAENVLLELDYFDHSLTGIVDGESVAFEGDGEWYRREFEAFLRASAAHHGNPDIRSDFDDAVKTLDVTLTAREAAESGDRVRTAAETAAGFPNGGATL